MHVQFTHNQEEIVDAWLRASKRSQVIRRMRRRRSVLLALLAGLFVLVFVRFSISGIIAAAVAVLLCLLTDPWFYRYAHRKSLRKLIKERYGEESQFDCQVELLPQGVKTNTSDVELTLPWETIAEIVETSDSVDIFARQGFCIIRNRAFSSGDERQRFIDLAHEYVNKARPMADK